MPPNTPPALPMNEEPHIACNQARQREVIAAKRSWGTAMGPLSLRSTEGAIGALPCWLWFENQRRPADALPLEVDSHLNAVGDLDEGNAAVHPVILAIKGHCPFNLA